MKNQTKYLVLSLLFIVLLGKSLLNSILLRRLKVGDNTIETKVTNLWVNRLIGDAQPDVKQKITFTTIPFYQGKEPLLPSGLLGPVRIVLKK